MVVLCAAWVMVNRGSSSDSANHAPTYQSNPAFLSDEAAPISPPFPTPPNTGLDFEAAADNYISIR